MARGCWRCSVVAEDQPLFERNITELAARPVERLHRCASPMPTARCAGCAATPMSRTTPRAPACIASTAPART